MTNEGAVHGRAELAGLPLGPWTSRRREELPRLRDQLDPVIDELVVR